MDMTLGGTLEEEPGRRGLLRDNPILEFITRSKARDAELLDRELVKQGVDSTRAFEISRKLSTAKNILEKDTFKKELNLSQLEQKAIKKRETLTRLGTVVDLPIFPAGIANISKSTAIKIAKSKSAREIEELLIKEVPNLTDDVKRVFSNALVHIDEADDVQKVINRTKFALQDISKAKKAVDTKALKAPVKKAVVKTNLDIAEQIAKRQLVSQEEIITVLKRVNPQANEVLIEKLGSDVRVLGETAKPTQEIEKFIATRVNEAIERGVKPVKEAIEEVTAKTPKEIIEGKPKIAEELEDLAVAKELLSDQPLPRGREIKPVDTTAIVPDVSLPNKIVQKQGFSKVLREEGRVLVDESGKQVFPQPIKQVPTPLEKTSVAQQIEKKVGGLVERKLGQVDRKRARALDFVDKKHGQTDVIVERLKKQGVSQAEIDSIVLENGVRLVDTVKIKREKNGVLSAVITKEDLKEMEEGFTGTNLVPKWIPVKTALQKATQAGRDAKSVALEYYELPQIFFDRTGLREFFYDPIRQAERNAQDVKTAIYKEFEEAGLMKRGGWFTADRFDLSSKEAERLGRYFLERQGRGGGVKLADLSAKEKEFVRIFDNFIKETEPRFRKVAALNGKTPGVVENYAPIMTSDDVRLAQEIGDMDYIFRKHPSFFSLKKRAEKVPFETYELDYRKVAVRWIDQITNFNHLGEVGPQTKYYANSEEFKEIVGSEVWATTNKWLKDKFNPQVLSPAEKGGRFLRQKTSIASLGLNVSSVIKQALSIIPITIIEKAPPKFTSKFAKNFGIKVSDLPSLKERKGNAAIMDMQEGLSKIFVGPLAEFDKKIAQVELNSLLDKNYKTRLKEGKEITPEIQAQILKESQDLIDIWMGGMTTAQLPRAFRSEIGKLLNMFIMPLTSQLNGFIYSMMKEKGVKQASKAAEVLAAAIGIAYMEQVITNLSPTWSNKKDMMKDTLGSLAGNIPVISSIIFAIRSDQPLAPSAAVSAVSRFVQQISKGLKDQATAGDIAFATAELFLGLPKQVRRTYQGAKIVKDGGVRDKSGKLLVQVKGTDETIRAFLRGKYGTIATQDWIKNIGIKSADRSWFVPEVEFLQNGDYDRKAALYKTFDKETQDELYAELSEGQQKKLDKALKSQPQKGGSALDKLRNIGGGSALERLKNL